MIAQTTDRMDEDPATAIDEATCDVDFDAWVNGESISAASGQRFETRDSAVDAVIRTVPRCEPVDVAIDGPIT